MARPEQVDVWIGLDIGKEDHFAEVLDDAGERIFGRGVANDEAALDALLERAGQHGTAGLVIDQPGSIAQLTLAVAARRQVPMAYVPGLVMRRAADLYPGEAKTDKRDAFIIADTGRTRRRQVHWLDAGSDELLGQLRRSGKPLAGGRSTVSILLITSCETFTSAGRYLRPLRRRQPPDRLGPGQLARRPQRVRALPTAPAYSSAARQQYQAATDR